MKVVLIGNTTPLGCAFLRVGTELGVEMTPLDLPDFDLTFRRFVLETIEPLQPDVIVNTAEIPLIDWLESHPNTARSYHVQGTVNLRDSAKRTNALFVHCSTMEVFGDVARSKEKRGLTELRTLNPQSVYAKTRADAERAALEWDRHLIVRSSMLFGQSIGQSVNNFVETILNAVRRTRTFRVLDDLYFSPSWTDDVARAVFSLVAHSMKTGLSGIFHVANGGPFATHLQIARELSRLTGLKLELERISSAEYGFQAPRCLSCTPDCSKYLALSDVFPLRTWKKALSAYLDSRTVAR
ncbi:MAG: SDR family oxidoreductase [Thermoguttaceae bacterium]